MSVVMTRGVIFVHSAPSALCPHLEWAVGGVLDVPVNFDWVRQPAEPGMWRTEWSWQAKVGTGAQLSSALRGWAKLRFEVTEEPSPGADGARWSHTPALGLHHTVAGVHGDGLIGEDRLRAALSASSSSSDVTALVRELEAALGTAWDDELEPFRRAGEGASVRWLHQVG